MHERTLFNTLSENSFVKKPVTILLAFSFIFSPIAPVFAQEVSISPVAAVTTDPITSQTSIASSPLEVQSLPQGLSLERRGQDAGHYEIVPVTPFDPNFEALLKQITTNPY